MSRINTILLSLVLVALWGCSQAKKKEEAQVQPAPSPQTQAQPAVAPGPPPTATPKPAVSQATPQATTKKKRPQTDVYTLPAPSSTPSAERAAQVPPVRKAPVVIPAGTNIQVRLSEALDSSKNRTGDKFEAILDADLEVNDQVLIPRGAIVNGKVTEVVDAGRVQGLARMAITLSDIEVRGTTYPIRTNTQSFEAKSSKKEDAMKIGAGAGVGAIIGAIAGGKKGAAIGAATGAGAGTGVVLATKGKDVELPSEHKLTFRLSQDIRLN